MVHKISNKKNKTYLKKREESKEKEELKDDYSKECEHAYNEVKKLRGKK